MSSDLKKKFVSGVLWSALDKFIIQLGFLVTTLYIAKLIGPEDFGLVGMLTIFTLLAESIVSSGFSQALVQKSQALTECDQSTIFWVNLTWGVGIYLVLYASAPLIATFYDRPELVDIARLLFLIIVINSISVVVRAKLLIDVAFKAITITNMIATSLASIVGIFLANQGYGYWAFVFLLLLKALFLNMGLWLTVNWLPKFIFSKRSFQALFAFGSNLMLASIVATLVNNLYIALVGRYFSAVSVGYFSQATNLTNFLSQVISATLQGVTYPILTSIKEDRTRLVSLYKKLIGFTAFASLPALIGFAAIADTFVLLFLGGEWAPAIPIIQTLCLARAITPLNSINMSILNVVGRPDLFLKVDLLKLPITVSTLLISINYGIEAVAFALLTNVVLSFFINAYYPGKMLGFGAWTQIKLAKNHIFACVIMYWTLQVIVLELLWLDLAVKIILGVMLYISVLRILNDKVLSLLWVELKTKFLTPKPL